MSDKMKKTINNVVLTGKVAELEVRKGVTNKDSIPYISVKGAIQFGDNAVFTKRFEKYVQEYKEKDGKRTDSKVYPKVLAWVEKAKSIANSSYEEATEVCIQGSFAPNDYINGEDKVVESLKVDASFFNDITSTDTYKATADIEGYIQAIVPETKGDDNEETGRLRVTVVGGDFFGNAVVIKNIIVPVELRGDFEDAYEVGQTATFYIDFVATKSEAKPKKSGGLGVKRTTEGKSYLEMIVSGAESPLDEDDEKAISREAIKIALSERKEALAKLEKEGYQGKKEIGTSSTATSTSKKPTKVNDEDIPF